MLTWSEQSLHRFTPIFYRLIVHFYYDVPDQRRTDTFISKRKMNVRRIAAVEFEDGPHCGTHLLALNVRGVTGNTHTAKNAMKVATTASYREAAQVSFSSGTAPIISPAE
jgi:hypothetical protein